MTRTGFSMKTLIAAYSGVLRGTGSSILSALRDLFSITWLNRSKVEKQLQVISVLQWVLSFLMLGVACSIIFMYIFCTDCWLISVLYFTWLVFDWNTPQKGKGMGFPAPPMHPWNSPSCPSWGSSLWVLLLFT